jgi:hypothetical protein
MQRVHTGMSCRTRTLWMFSNFGHCFTNARRPVIECENAADRHLTCVCNVEGLMCSKSLRRHEFAPLSCDLVVACKPVWCSDALLPCRTHVSWSAADTTVHRTAARTHAHCYRACGKASRSLHAAHKGIRRDVMMPGTTAVLVSASIIHRNNLTSLQTSVHEPNVTARARRVLLTS